MNYDHKKKFGLLKFNSGYGKLYFNSPKGYNSNIINAQTEETPTVNDTVHLHPLLTNFSKTDQDIDL